MNSLPTFLEGVLSGFEVSPCDVDIVSDNAHARPSTKISVEVNKPLGCDSNTYPVRHSRWWSTNRNRNRNVRAWSESALIMPRRSQSPLRTHPTKCEKDSCVGTARKFAVQSPLAMIVPSQTTRVTSKLQRGKVVKRTWSESSLYFNKKSCSFVHEKDGPSKTPSIYPKLNRISIDKVPEKHVSKLVRGS